MGALDEVAAAIASVAGQVGPSVVGVGQKWATGSGIVVGDGQVLTNAHNVRGGSVTVVFADGRVAEGTLSGSDIEGDLAVVAVDTQGAAALSFAPDGTDVGAPVFALANPRGRGVRTTFGFVSATGRAFRGPRGRRVTGSIEHTAPMGRGSSGGPIVDGQGRLLGINTNRLGDGFYLAIPADGDLRTRIDALSRGESPAHARLGVGLAPSHVARHLRRAVGLDERDGLLVRAVDEDSPADRAGLRRGDLLVEAGGRPLTSPDDLYEALDGAGEDAPLTLRVVGG